MNLLLEYPDTATFVVAASGAYANDKMMSEQFEVNVVFVQNLQFRRTNFQDQIDADAICYPDIENEFIVSHFNRLEGMYVMMSLYGAPETISWFKVSQVVVNRDHLLNNEIDNIELRLKKANPVPGVS